MTISVPDTASGELKEIYDREVTWYRGTTLPVPDGLSAFFDGPARAVQCAAAIAAASGIHELRAGIHIGEVDPVSENGPVIRVSRYLASAAAAGDVLVSRTVVDLVPGSGLQFEDRGSVHLPRTDTDLPVMALRHQA
jgi:class 3 adenylate cyclase